MADHGEASYDARETERQAVDDVYVHTDLHFPTGSRYVCHLIFHTTNGFDSVAETKTSNFSCRLRKFYPPQKQIA